MVFWDCPFSLFNCVLIVCADPLARISTRAAFFDDVSTGQCFFGGVRERVSIPRQSGAFIKCGPAAVHSERHAKKCPHRWPMLRSSLVWICLAPYLFCFRWSYDEGDVALLASDTSACPSLK